MYKMKNKKEILAIIFVAFTILSVFAINSLVKPHETASAPLVSQSTQILGIWVLEEDSSVKIEFLSNGTLNTYHENVLSSTDSWVLTNACDGNTQADSEYYLKVTDSEGFVDCNIVTNLNDSGNDYLAFIIPRG